MTHANSPTPMPHPDPRATRQANTAKRNAKIRAAYAEQYTRAPRPRKFSREYVVAQLAETYCLSMATIEGIVWVRT